MGNINEQQKVSLKRIIGNVVDKLQLTDVSSRISAMAAWAVDAELKIGSRNSYEKFECEIEIANYRACLPENYVNMIAVKSGNSHLDYTMKDFVDFGKGSTSNPIEEPAEFIAGNKIQAAHPGVPNVHQVNFLGVFTAGDIINITIQNDNCGDSSVNNVTYTVLPGDSIPDIIAALVALINIIGAGVYTAVPDSSFLQIIANTPLINMMVTTYTNSITGQVSHQLIQARILPTEETSSNNDNCDVDIKTTSNNLANKHASLLNDNIYAEGSSSIADIDGNVSASKYAIQNGYVHFNGIEVGRVGVAYWGIALDKEGWPMIDLKHEDAVTHYLMYQLSWGDLVKGKISQGAFQTLEQRWYWLCGQARGDDELPNADEVQYMANMWNQLLPLPNKEYF